MSRKCELTGKAPTTGNNVSHSNIKTRRRWLPNLKKKRFLIPELSQTVTLTLAASSIKTIDKQGGISNALRKAKVENLSERLLKIRRGIEKHLSS